MNEATFQDRITKFAELTNPFYLIYGSRDVAWAREAKNQASPEKDRILRVSTHPDTGDTIPRPFRFGAAIPWNIGMGLAMAHPAVMLSVVRSAGIHWVNQTYNCAVNFANRNASSGIDYAVLAQTYCAACVLSVSIALGATVVMRRFSPTGWRLTALRACLPMLAASTASVVNVAMIRRSEWIDDGVNLYDEDGKHHGKSCRAGTEGIWKCGVTRAVANIPIITIPVFLAAGLTRFGVFRPSMRLEIACVFAGVCVGFPLCLALYPQRERIPAGRLEPDFRNRVSGDGRTPISHFYYNKGL